MKYCITCGTKLEEKYLQKEGWIPFCHRCDAFRFPHFNVAVSMIVLNMSLDKLLLIQQSGMTGYHLVAGYINKGESAEHAAKRELQEEVGITVSEILFNKSEFFAKTNTLMLNFICKSTSEHLVCDEDEVSHAQWFTVSAARQKIDQGSLAQEFLEYYLRNNPQLSL